MNPFLNSRRELRNGWWILIFFAILAALLLPLLIVMRAEAATVTTGMQATIVAIASLICQRLRRRPIAELTGRFDRHWLRQLLAGCAIGAALMLLPALFLRVSGFVTWTRSNATWSAIGADVLLFIGVALTEELLFRGFVFQRLIDGTRVWIAQLIISAYFVLTHSAALKQAGDVRYLATANIFVASLLFGFAFLRTRSLAMPLGLHFAANVTQGTLLGFGVSGFEQTSILVPQRAAVSDWITGGAFGLEASVPCFLAVLAATWLVYRWRRVT